MNEEIFDRNKFKFTHKKTIKLVENKNDVDKKKEAISFLNKQLRLYNLDIKNKRGKPHGTAGKPLSSPFGAGCDVKAAGGSQRKRPLD